jgi:16S rRNA processing protein RimM
MRRELPPGRYYYDDLVGLSVRTCGGRDLGAIQDVLENPAHDLFVTEQGLIPASRDTVREVDLERRVIVVADIASPEM